MHAPVPIRRPLRGLPKPALPHLRDLPRPELEAWVEHTLGGPRYRAGQIFGWLHRQRAATFDAMTNLSRSDRARLVELAQLAPLEVDQTLLAADGTCKLRLRTPDDAAIEAVVIPNESRGTTLCISSMVGCSLTCRFCATSKLGFVRNLSTWEIVDQVYRAQDHLLQADPGFEPPAESAEGSVASWSPRIVNLVLMGMGEPLHNFTQVRRALQILTDPQGAAIAGRRITVSTAGLVPAIERFAAEGLAEEVGLAVSLNATTDAVRDEIMPINRRWNIGTLLDTVRRLPRPKRRLITFEYVLLADVNDSDDDARRLADLIGGIDSQVNAIPFNPHPLAPYRRPTPDRIARFVDLCRGRGLRVHVRTPRGDDIGAACGQLAGTQAAS